MSPKSREAAGLAGSSSKRPSLAILRRTVRCLGPEWLEPPLPPSEAPVRDGVAKPVAPQRDAALLSGALCGALSFGLWPPSQGSSGPAGFPACLGTHAWGPGYQAPALEPSSSRLCGAAIPSPAAQGSWATPARLQPGGSLPRPQQPRGPCVGGGGGEKGSQAPLVGRLPPSPQGRPLETSKLPVPTFFCLAGLGREVPSTPPHRGPADQMG
uniref:Uncharacterized protein n=1 Tax=Sphaerodactylus townsendi TaxID=933632 RepID=A0ACB8E6S3_9SAUR